MRTTNYIQHALCDQQGRSTFIMCLLFLAGNGVTMQANCYPNGTVKYSWSSRPPMWHLQIEYQCYNNGTTHQQTVSFAHCKFCTLIGLLSYLLSL